MDSWRLQSAQSNSNLKSETSISTRYSLSWKNSQTNYWSPFLQRNNTILDLRQGVLNFPFFSMQSKTADHKYTNVMEPVSIREDITIPPNDRHMVSMYSNIYADTNVTGILQPSNAHTEDGDLTFCAALVTLTQDLVTIHVNNFTDQPYTIKRGSDIANFSVLTPEQMKYVKPIDTVTTWHLLQGNPENAVS